MRHAIVSIIAALGVGGPIAETARAETTVYVVDEPYRPGTVSLGLGLGDPTALDVKFWTGNTSGINLGVGLQRFDDIFGIYGEYELGIAAFRLSPSGGRGAFYIGVGGALAFRDNYRDEDRTSLAVVVPIGLDFRFSAPVDLFIEARPGVGVLNRPAFGIGGQLGVRFRL